MKIVFPYLGSEQLGISYLVAMLKTGGFAAELAFEPHLFDDTKFLHFPAVPRMLKYNERFAEHIIAMQPTLLAFSVFTMNYRWALDIARRVREKIAVTTVFGGVHVQLLPEKVLANPAVDYVIVGEGEYPLLELVASLARGKTDTGIANLGYKVNGRPVLNPCRPLLEDLDVLPWPDREIFARHEDYRESMLYLCGRGCHYGCTFCASPALKCQYPNPQSYVRFHSVSRCLHEMRVLKDRHGTRHFQIQDDVFTGDLVWLKEFCARYPREVGVPFQVAVYPSAMDEEKIRLLRDAGCIFIQVGVQSLNADNRRAILHRYESDEQVAACIALAKKYGMGVSVDYIFFPWEKNDDDQLRAARFFHRCRPTRIANFYLSYLPGTAMLEYAGRQGLVTAEERAAIESGANAYYHAGGEFMARRADLCFFNNYYNFFILLLLLPPRVGGILFALRAYRYARFVPKLLLLVVKELIMPRLGGGAVGTPHFVKYAGYYLRNLRISITGNYR